MRVSVKKSIAKERLKNGGFWHLWFAWHPVRINNELVWFEFVRRKRLLRLGTGGSMYDVLYRNLTAPSGS